MLLFFQVKFRIENAGLVLTSAGSQMKAVLKNQTGIEDWIKEKADYRLRRTEEKFVWPYDLGRLENFKQVIGFSCQPRSDGMTWPVAEGCDQYSLTREQLKQKEDKRGRTREYQVITLSPVNTTVLVSNHFLSLLR